MDAIATFEGVAHVTTWASAGMKTLTGFDPVGLPAREVWPGFDEAQRLMDECLVTGEPQERIETATDGTVGVLVILPRRRHGVVFGVTTAYRAVPQLRREPRSLPAPRVVA